LDVNGNRYHLAQIYAVDKGRQDRVELEVNWERNAECRVFEYFQDWEAILSFHSTVAIRDWNHTRKYGHYIYEGSEEAKDKLTALFGHPPLGK